MLSGQGRRGAREMRNTGLHTFFHPDCTVDPGVSPDHAQFYALVGCHHRSGIGIFIPHPAPKVKYSSMA